MNTPFQIEIGFVDEAADSGLLTIGGHMISGELCNGAKGYVEVESVRLELTVKDVAFLKDAKPDAIMFTALKPESAPELDKWVGSRFVSKQAMSQPPA